MSTLPEAFATEPVRRLPGDLAMWCFILAELTLFAALIITFAVSQALNRQLFSAGRALLDRSTGLDMTLSLLSSGALIALGVVQVRKAEQRRGAYLLIAAFLSALVYVWIKSQEYWHLAHLGLNIERDTFFTLFWILTGLHFVHVLLGMLIIVCMSYTAWRGEFDPQAPSAIESGALYWHMVDLIWLMLFPVVYLING